MARPRKVIRTRFLHVGIREDVMAKVNIQLFSEVEGRVPQGAYQTLVTQLFVDWLATQGVTTDTNPPTEESEN